MADFEFPIRIYWEDTDAGGVVYYANYLKFFERARTEWLRALGVDQLGARAQLGGVFVAVEANLRYIRPARLDDQLLATAGLLAAVGLRSVASALPWAAALILVAISMGLTFLAGLIPSSSAARISLPPSISIALPVGETITVELPCSMSGK